MNRNNQKKYRIRNFRPWPDNEERLAIADKLEFNVSLIINEALNNSLDEILVEHAKKLEANLKAIGIKKHFKAGELVESKKEVVRGEGIEPSTPTVSM